MKIIGDEKSRDTVPLKYERPLEKCLKNLLSNARRIVETPLGNAYSVGLPLSQHFSVVYQSMGSNPAPPPGWSAAGIA
jgi:hypothetical protein